MENLFIGLMSGTSVDSIDSALVNIDTGSFELLESSSSSIKKNLKKRIFEAVNSADISKVEIEELDVDLGRAFGKAANRLIQKASLNNRDISAIGSHGQTIKHAPNTIKPYSLQIGKPEEITRVTKIKTVADFRTADIQAGGQGAPLAPLFHKFIFKKNKLSEGVIINIGGICNLTYLNNLNEDIIAYDCGPGNCLIDAWNRSNNNGEFDEEGSWASSGKFIPKLLEVMLRDPFFSQQPPKSTGTDYFNLSWVKQNVSNCKSVFSPEDIQATLTELTAQVIFKELKNLKAQKKRIYICGGGIHNTFLINRLEGIIENNIFSTSLLGIDPDFLEASCFAWLAHQRLDRNKFDLSKVTGSQGRVLLGEVWEAS